MDTERPCNADAHARVARARFAGEARHVSRRVSPRPEEVGHHHDLARAGGGAGVDRFGQRGPREREVRRRDLAPGQPAAERRGDRGELAVRCALAAAVIDEDDGAHVGGSALHQ
jgi:hypothetical protein